ncbi:MAG TPA: T9SS type A sorting domain-containing protein [Candidatus Eisenbacteria bacterium]|nr:T9SS type A sorting domain-containing protein [Candidatus Eisenbacteria bacterium]
MRRISLFSLALLTVMLVPVVAVAATPNPNGAVVLTRVFNDCPFTTVNVVNNYPALISIEDNGLECSGFANLHLWSLSADGGTTQATFENNSDFRFSTDLVISGSGNAEAGIRITPWWSNTDGRFNVRSTDGEIACFGGRLPFFSFTGAYGLHYQKGETINLEVTYKPHGLNASSPATIEYELTYQGQTYSSGGLTFDQGNPAEDPPHGLWGILDNVHVGGYSQNFMTPGDPTSVKVTYTNMKLVICPVEPDADDAIISTRIFNDCPFTTLTVNDDYPSSISINDGPLVCTGFANLHTWTVSDDGRVGHRIQNDDDFRIACDFSITGPGEGGLRISPWWSQNADGLFNLRSTDGEIAVFGGRLPFFSFTGAFGNLRYQAGETAHLEMIYRHNGLSSASPATIEYKLGLRGVEYTSGPLSFDQANPSEDPPNGLWGILNNARAGGHMKAFLFTNQPDAFATGTWTNMEFEAGADVSVKITPSSFNPNSGGNFVSAVIEPAAPLSASDIDVSTLRLNGQLGPSSAEAPVLGDENENGITDLTVRFARTAAMNAIGSSGVASVTGEVGGVCFVATDNVKVVKVKGPSAGASVAAGSTVEVSWDTPGGMGAATADIYTSIDGGEVWTLEASGVSNNGRYNWHVGSATSTNARVAVVLHDGNEIASGMSGSFVITTPVGVGPEGIAFALKGVSPNPAKGPFGINFALPDGKRATLSVFDVSGRRVASREVGGLGAGRHTVTLGKGLKAGVYMIRLDREGSSLTARAAVIQ